MAEMDVQQFLSALTQFSSYNEFARYVLATLSDAFGFNDSMLVGVLSSKYHIRRLRFSEYLEDVVVDDGRRDLLKYAARERKPLNRFDFPKGRLISAAVSPYENAYAFGGVVPLISLGRTSGYLVFNHPVNRKPVSADLAELFDRLMIPLGLALDIALLQAEKSKLDPETGLLRKAVFLDEFSRELRRTSLSGQPLTLGILEFEGWEDLLSRYGAAEVGELEILAGSQLRRNSRANDMLFSFGQGRFLAILCDTSKHASQPAILRLKKSLERLLPVWNLRVSTGIAAFPDDGDTTGTLFQAAQKDMKG